MHDPAPAAPLRCRFCGGVAYVPGSTCPHCGREVMAVCPQCKRYVDNQLENCDHCGAALAALGEIAQALDAAAGPRARVPQPDNSLPPPPREMTDERWVEVLKLPGVMIVSTLLSFLVIERLLLPSPMALDPTGVVRAIAIALYLYPLAAAVVAVRSAQRRARLLAQGQAVRGSVERVQRRSLRRPFGQRVAFAYADLRGHVREGSLSPLTGLDRFKPGAEVTVLYMPEAPAECTIYPFTL